MGDRTTNNKYKGIKKASKTSIEISFNYKKERCRERITGIPSSSNLRKAAVFRDDILTSIENGTFDYGITFPNSKNPFSTEKQIQPTLVKEYLEKWLYDQKDYLMASTFNDYRKTVNNQLIPNLGDIHLTQLNIKDVKNFVMTIKASDKRIRNIISPLRCALNDAEDDGDIDENPIKNWKVRGKKRRTTDITNEQKITPFTFDEREAILNALTGQAKNLVLFIMWTGLRTSEFIALDWNDIDFKNETVYINKALTQAATKPETTKTPAGKRRIKLLPEALKALKMQKKYTWKKGKEIFQNPKKNKRWTGDQAVRRTMWQPALKKAGVDYRYPYQTRHTFASMMLTDGEHIVWLSKQLGHTDWSFTARTYAKYIEDDDPGAGKKAAEAHRKRKKSKHHDNDPSPQ